ncbi:MAG: hypothetical protein ACK4L7_02355 [Flavobacteriales bacterium]
MNASPRLLLAVSASLGLWLTAFAQGIEDVLVERYHVRPGATADAPPLITYRIFLDLAPGHSLVSIFGEKKRNLIFETTTRFVNDTLRSVPWGNLVDPGALRQYPAALDSWLAFGFATNAHKGVPLHLDRDGSMLRGCKAYGDALMARDGLARADVVPEVLCLDLSTSFVDRIDGNFIETEVGAFGVRGTVKGATEENMVLIAQLTTDGELSFAINAAVRAPDGAIVKHLAYPAAASDETQVPSLRRMSAH